MPTDEELRERRLWERLKPLELLLAQGTINQQQFEAKKKEVLEKLEGVSCLSCGAFSPRATNFCPNCGAELRAQPAQAMEPEVQRARLKEIARYLAAFLAITALSILFPPLGYLTGIALLFLGISSAISKFIPPRYVNLVVVAALIGLILIFVSTLISGLFFNLLPGARPEILSVTTQAPYTEPPKQTPAPEPLKTPTNALELYDFDHVLSYEYSGVLRTKDETFPRSIKFTMTRDTVDGRDAWLMESQMVPYESLGSPPDPTKPLVVRSWLDASTGKCFKREYDGRPSESCRDDYPYDWGSFDEFNVNFDLRGFRVRMVSSSVQVTIAAGTFMAAKYESGGKITVPAGTFTELRTWWVAEGVPVPIMRHIVNEMDGRTAVDELVQIRTR